MEGHFKGIVCEDIELMAFFKYQLVAKKSFIQRKREIG